MRLNLVLLFTLVCLVTVSAQENGGVGMVLGIEKPSGALKVLRVLPESPAAKAGLKPGVILHRVGETAVAGKGLPETVELIRGPVGSKLKLEFVDPAAHATNSYELVRERIVGKPKARLGDAASPLFAKEWVQGDPVDVCDGKAVYVVEFWATWCGPCRVTIPHLNQLQKRFKGEGVIVVGISDEDPAKVKPFVKTMGSQMEYRVACDDGAQTNFGYMQAFGVNTIPTAFIVGKDGRVLWFGHPMAGLDKALENVLAGNHKL